MDRRLLLMCCVWVGLGISVPSFVLAQTQARTVWGHPDLQGEWANNTATPMERPASFEGKDALTDEELATLQQATASAAQ